MLNNIWIVGLKFTDPVIQLVEIDNPSIKVGFLIDYMVDNKILWILNYDDVWQFVTPERYKLMSELMDDPTTGSLWYFDYTNDQFLEQVKAKAIEDIKETSNLSPEIEE